MCCLIIFKYKGSSRNVTFIVIEINEFEYADFKFKL